MQLNSGTLVTPKKDPKDIYKILWWDSITGIIRIKNLNPTSNEVFFLKTLDLSYFISNYILYDYGFSNTLDKLLED